MNENKEKSCFGGKCDHIEGIVCDVKNCTYHDCDTHCTAKQIKVSPSHAEHSADTACSTFKPRSEF